MKKIHFIYYPIKNGMYENRYTVYYDDGSKRTYKIKFSMCNKHFNIILNAFWIERIESSKGRHIADRFYNFD